MFLKTGLPVWPRERLGGMVTWLLALVQFVGKKIMSVIQEWGFV